MAAVRIALRILVGMASYAVAFGQQTVSLAWDPSPETNVVAYYIYFGVDSGVYTNRMQVGYTNGCSVGGLTSGFTYFFVVTSCDGDGLESDPSNEVSYLVPGLARIRAQLDGGMPSIMFSVSPGQSYEVQASRDLQSWSAIWRTTGSSNGWVEFRDIEFGHFRERFYRVVGRVNTGLVRPLIDKAP